MRTMALLTWIACIWACEGCAGNSSGDDTALDGSTDAGAIDEHGLFCEERTHAALVRIAMASAVIDGDLVCEKDEDCTVVSWATDCFERCSEHIALRNVEIARTAVARANLIDCQGFVAAGCTRGSLPCATLPPAVCRLGICRNRRID